jgi:F-type H+-transporting ATPase subunit gamma
MAGTREIRRRIKSVKNIGQITRAMELVAASKMRKAQEAATAGRTYTKTLHHMTRTLLRHTDPRMHILLRRPQSARAKKVLVVVIGPNKGLCGGLITNLLRVTHQFLRVQADADVITMGRRVRDSLIRQGSTIVADFPLHERPLLRHVLPLSHMAVEGFTQQAYREVWVIHSHFISTLRQEPRVIQLLPLATESLVGYEKEAAADLLDEEFQYEPTVDAVLTRILPRVVDLGFYQALLESVACEHSARMIAMKNAGDNAHELQDELVLTFNQLRQAAITAEVAEIAAGTAA